MDTKPLTIQANAAVVLAVFVAVMAPLMACSQEIETPEEAVSSFLDNLRRGERVQAMEAIWPPTRDELEVAYDDMEAFLGDAPPMERSRLLLVTRLDSSFLISSIDAEEAVPTSPEHGERVLVTIELRDQRLAQVPVRWGGDQEKRWYVDLPVDQRRRLVGDVGEPEVEADKGAGADDGANDEAADPDNSADDESPSVTDEMTDDE